MWACTDRQTDEQMDGHMDSQHDTIIHGHYCVAGYKKRWLGIKVSNTKKRQKQKMYAYKWLFIFIFQDRYMLGQFGLFGKGGTHTESY